MADALALERFFPETSDSVTNSESASFVAKTSSIFSPPRSGARLFLPSDPRALTAGPAPTPLGSGIG